MPTHAENLDRAEINYVLLIVTITNIVNVTLVGVVWRSAHKVRPRNDVHPVGTGPRRSGCTLIEKVTLLVGTHHTPSRSNLTRRTLTSELVIARCGSHLRNIR